MTPAPRSASPAQQRIREAPEQPDQPSTSPNAVRSTDEAPARAAAPARGTRSRLAGSAHANRRAASELRRSAALLPEWAERFEVFATQLEELAEAIDALRPPRKPHKRRRTGTASLTADQLERGRQALEQLAPELAARVATTTPRSSGQRR